MLREWSFLHLAYEFDCGEVEVLVGQRERLGVVDRVGEDGEMVMKLRGPEYEREELIGPSLLNTREIYHILAVWKRESLPRLKV